VTGIERHLGVDKDSQQHPGTDLPARGYGAEAMRIDDPAKIEAAVTAALRSERSIVIVIPVANARR
jgi:thiamine pyrophosphate-dependent acetolactate synthase large subunit-like protein